jgi:hypothetical protein
MMPMPDHRRTSINTAPGRPIVQSPPLSPRQTSRPDYAPHEPPSRFPPGDEWDRGRPAHGYREQHPALPYSLEGRPLPSPAGFSPHPPHSRPASAAAHTPTTELISPRDGTPPQSATDPKRKGAKEKAVGSNGVKKAPVRRSNKVNTPTSATGPKPPSMESRMPLSAPISTAPSSSDKAAPADEHDQAGMDALLALSGHASEAAPMATSGGPRKRALYEAEPVEAPNSKKQRGESTSARGTPQPGSPAGAPPQPASATSIPGAAAEVPPT